MNTINQLPDDAMLSHIISSISIDEAVRSSILSNRWKPLWKHASCLDFDVSPMIKPLYQFENSSSRVVNFDQIKSTQQHAHRYGRFEYQVLLHHLGDLITALALHLSIVEMEKWVEFVILKKGLRS